jgi:hypothetical protein
MNLAQSRTESQKIEDRVVTVLNMARTRPTDFLRILDDRIGSLNGLTYTDEAQERIVETLEGRQAVLEVYDVLEGMVAKLLPLEINRNLQKSARDQLSCIAANGGEPTHMGEDGLSMQKRISSAIGKIGCEAECIVIGEGTAENIVLNLLIDDGLTDRPNRDIVLNKDFKSVGVAFGQTPDGSYQICVLHFFGYGNMPETTLFPSNALDDEPWLLN